MSPVNVAGPTSPLKKVTDRFIVADGTILDDGNLTDLDTAQLKAIELCHKTGLRQVVLEVVRVAATSTPPVDVSDPRV